MLKHYESNRQNIITNSMFIDINFQFGEFAFQDGSFCSDLAVGVISALLGALIAVPFGIFLYNRQRSIELDDTLRYMLHLLGRAIGEYEEDIRSLRKFFDKVQETPHELPELNQRTNYDVKRLVERIDQNRCYIAYLKHNKTVEEFTELYSILDFYHEVMVQLREQLERAKNFDHNRKLRFVQITQELKTEIVLMRANPALSSNQVLWSEMEFTRNIPNEKDVKFWHDNYVTPLIGVFEQYSQYFPNHDKWVSHLMEAKSINNNIQAQNKVVASDFKYYSDKLNDHFKRLVEHKGTLSCILKEND